MKVNFTQIRSVATGQFSGDAKALFIEGLKTDTEIADALDALEVLLKQISKQQIIIANEKKNINQTITSVIDSNNTGSNIGGISLSLVAEVKQAGFISELMFEIKAQIQEIIKFQISVITPRNTQQIV
ncbi:MAG: hypothetical protein CBD16_09990 [Betaproteobacteria bacterium TMED156]|nr:MAG: hypothetical protein CBD16_09990 [Betaproteobacteria bacterium TMED156]